MNDVLDAVRYDKIDNENMNCYIIIGGIHNEPREIFVSHADDNDIKLQNKIANITGLTRFISKSFQYEVPNSEIIHQLERSSRNKNDIPDLIRQCILQFITRFDTLSKNHMQKWRFLDSDRECILEEGVKAGIGWSKIQT